MKITGNTVLITGGATGIGLALAKALLERGNEVIVCGRRADRLTAARTSNPSLRVRVADVADAKSRADLLAWIRDSFPRTNVLVNNAGVQHLVDFQGGAAELAKADEEIATNLSAPIHLTSLMLPLLASRPEAAIVNISSGLGFAPMARMPVYCATKAALHSLTVSLRHQLRETRVKVFEVIPPIVTSDLGADHRLAEANRAAMPAEAAAAAIVAGLEGDVLEIAIGDAENLRAKRDALFEAMNRS
ncbi:MAG: SDR family oxidoreductase [Thermoanaerobaculaceae bacterium]|jgi:uncharacterized oxidoreductase